MRISTTTLESFRLWREPEQDWMTEDDLVAQIRGEFQPTPITELGTAFDHVLNDPQKHQVDGGYTSGLHFFPDLMMAPVLELLGRRGVSQVKHEKAYGDCVIVAKADELIGVRCIENKTTTGQFNIDKYLESYQWRYLIDVFGVRMVTYRVFLLSDPEQGAIRLREIQSFNTFPYAELHYDCERLVREFATYARSRGLEAFLAERQEQYAARY